MKQHPKIIGLTGPMGCGKDTVAQLLTTYARFKQLAFAEPLRQQLCDAFNVDYWIFVDRKLKEQATPALALERCGDMAFFGVMLKHKPVDVDHYDYINAPRSPRQLMRWWGSQYRRDTVSPDYWTRILKARVYAQQEGGQWRHVISDVRFELEAKAIRAMGGQIWQVKRPGVAADSTQDSETDGSAFNPDVVINNRHDMRHLQLLVMGAWMCGETGFKDNDLIALGNAIASEAEK